MAFIHLNLKMENSIELGADHADLHTPIIDKVYKI